MNILNLYFYRQPIYFGPNVFGNDLLQESKQLKLLNHNIELYNLKNDDLFGKPLNTKWIKIDM